MKIRIFVIILVVTTLVSSCAHMPRGGRGNLKGNIATGLSIGVGVGIISALTAPRYKPGHHTDQLPRNTQKIRFRNINYRYSDGIYYRHLGGSYRVVLPPAGLKIYTLPSHTDKLIVNGKTYFVSEGVYYTAQGGMYMVVQEPIESEVNERLVYKLGQHYLSLPKGAQPVVVNDVQYFTYHGIAFLPQSINGQVKYLAVKLS